MPVGRRWKMLAASGRVRSVAAGNPHDVVEEFWEVRQEVSSVSCRLHGRDLADSQAVLCGFSVCRVSSRRIFRVGAVFPHASPKVGRHRQFCSARPATSAHRS
jgi:hypothetical protein